jgi:oxygen-independent coproporphyrinogen-3 oxidase
VHDQARELVVTDFLSQIKELLRHGLLRRVREGIGGSHTVVTYPPLDAIDNIDRSQVEIQPLFVGLNLYFHVAFCEYICPFCAYAKTYSDIGRETDHVTQYIDAVIREISWRKSELGHSSIESIYIGGGTPTSLSLRLLEKLVNNVLSISTDRKPNFCVETSPLTVATADGKEKLRLLRDFGVNRFSLGVQTFNEASLKLTRGHDRSTLLRAIEHLKQSGCRLNIDLIQDLPHQTRADIELDLHYIEQYRPEQVTWYLLRFHDEASWHKPYARGDLYGIPEDSESALRRLEIIGRMEDMGYHRRPGGRFMLSSRMHDLYKEVRGGTDKALLGFGVSAYSHGWGWFFRNTTAKSGKSGINEYVRRINAGVSPIASVFELTQEERTAGRLVSSVRDFIEPAWLQENDAATQSAVTVVHKLLDHGALTKDPEGRIMLSPIGVAFEEEVASLFYSPAVRARLSERGSYWAADCHPAN